MKVGDLVKHYDQLYAGLGLVVSVASKPTYPATVHYVCVQYGDVTDWIDTNDLEIVNASR